MKKINKAIDQSIETLVTDGIKVNITVPTQTLISTAITIVITTCLILLINYAVKKYAK